MEESDLNINEMKIFKLLKEKLSKTTNSLIWKFLITFLSLIMAMVIAYNKHESEISETREKSITNSEKIKTKVDISEFKQFIKLEEDRNKKLDKIYDYIINKNN